MHGFLAPRPSKEAKRKKAIKNSRSNLLGWERPAQEGERGKEVTKNRGSEEKCFFFTDMTGGVLYLHAVPILKHLELLQVLHQLQRGAAKSLTYRALNKYSGIWSSKGRKNGTS
jgi:hypothetical protein